LHPETHLIKNPDTLQAEASQASANKTELTSPVDLGWAFGVVADEEDEQRRALWKGGREREREILDAFLVLLPLLARLSCSLFFFRGRREGDCVA
jgi:hypothetical protein